MISSGTLWRQALLTLEHPSRKHWHLEILKYKCHHFFLNTACNSIVKDFFLSKSEFVRVSGVHSPYPQVLWVNKASFNAPTGFNVSSTVSSSVNYRQLCNQGVLKLSNWQVDKILSENSCLRNSNWKGLFLIGVTNETREKWIWVLFSPLNKRIYSSNASQDFICKEIKPNIRYCIKSSRTLFGMVCFFTGLLHKKEITN